MNKTKTMRTSSLGTKSMKESNKKNSEMSSFPTSNVITQRKTKEELNMMDVCVGD